MKNLSQYIIILLIFIMLNHSVNANYITKNNELGINGTNIDLKLLPNYEIPVAKGDKIVTLNQTGYMKTELDIFSQDFIDYASTINLPVLEVGAAYGAVALKALEKGATVIANDIDERHLTALYHNVPSHLLANLYLKIGYFPNEVDFPNNSLGAILICRVAHFFNGQEIEYSFNKMQKWLIPGGRIYFVSISPYHHLLHQKFLPLYKARLQNGDKWPGIITNMREYNPQESEDIPNFLHAFEEEVMTRFLKQQGFIIKKIQKFDYSNNSSNNQGYLGFIAIKP